MYDELRFREQRLPLKTIAITGAASVAVYAAVSLFGTAALLGIAGLTVGYLVARGTKL